jgi:hypothetical protein
MINPQTANPEISTKYCKTVLKVVFLHDFCIMYKSNFYQSIICYICKEKGYEFAYLRKFEVRKSQKKIGSANRKNPRFVTFAEIPQIYIIKGAQV